MLTSKTKISNLFLIEESEDSSRFLDVLIIKKQNGIDIQMFPSEIWTKIFQFCPVVNFRFKLICKQIENLDWKSIWRHYKFKIYTSLLPWAKFSFSICHQLKVITDEENDREFCNFLHNKKVNSINSNEILQKIRCVERLDLSESLIDEVGLYNLFSTTHFIKSLNISGCQKAYNGLNHIKGIEELNLSNLKLFKIPLHLMKIKKLILSKTELKGKKLNFDVEVLDLSKCKIPLSSIESFGSLKELTFTGTQHITDEIMKLIADVDVLNAVFSLGFTSKGLFNLKKIKKLSLEGDSFSGTTDLSEGIAYLQSIEDLSLKNIKICEKSLEKLKNLKHLHLTRIPSFYGLCFKSMKNLQTLYLEKNDATLSDLQLSIHKLTLNSMYSLDNDTFKNMKMLKELVIDNCYFTDEIFQYLPNLKKLKISDCVNITGKGFDHLNLTFLTIKNGIQDPNNELIKNASRYLTKSLLQLKIQTEHFDASHLLLFKKLENLVLKDCSHLNYSHLLKVKGPSIYIKGKHEISKFDVSTLRQNKIKIEVDNPKNLMKPFII